VAGTGSVPYTNLYWAKGLPGLIPTRDVTKSIVVSVIGIVKFLRIFSGVFPGTALGAVGVPSVAVEIPTDTIPPLSVGTPFEALALK
jgi:hypothetical protein